MEKAIFDAGKYKETTREQWQTAAEAWSRWTPTLAKWLGPATEIMLDMAKVDEGKRVLDVAAGAGDQSIRAGTRVGPDGYVLATDISSNILEYAAQSAKEKGLTNIETRVMDGEALEFPEGSFDAAISRVGMIYFPDQQKALTGIRKALKPGGRFAAIVYSTAENNKFFSTPVSIIRSTAQLPLPLPGQPGPFSLGTEEVLENTLKEAGFVSIKTCAVSAPLVMQSALECVRFEQESFGALHQMIAGLDEEGKVNVWKEIEHALRLYETSNGFEGPCELLIVVGTNP